MKPFIVLGLLTVAAFPQQTAPARPAACDPVGDVQFICGAIGPEDLVTVPGGEWVIASGDAAGGAPCPHAAMAAGRKVERKNRARIRQA